MKRFFQIALESEDLEVDKEAARAINGRKAPEEKQVLDAAVAAAEKPAESEESADQDTPTETPEEGEKVTPVEVPPEQNEGEEKPEAAAAPEEETKSPEELVEEGEENSQQVEDAAKEATSLEEIAERIRDSLDTGGMDPASADIVLTAVEPNYRRLGIKRNDILTPSTESYAVITNKKQKTLMVLESIMDKINTIYDYIVKALQRAIKWLVDYVKSLFGSFDKHKKTIDMLTKALEKLRQAPPKQPPATGVPMFKNEAAIRVLKLEFDFEPLIDLPEFKNTISDFFQSLKTNSIYSIKRVNEMIEALVDGNVDVPDELNIEHFIIRNMHEQEVPGYKPDNELLETLVHQNYLVGDRMLVSYVPKTRVLVQKKGKNGSKDRPSTELEQRKAWLEAKTFLAIDQKAVRVIKEVPLMSLDDTERLLGCLTDLIDEGEKAKVLFNDFIKQKNELNKTITKLKGEDEEVDEDKEYFIQRLFDRIQLTDRFFVNPASQIGSMLDTVLTAGESYASESLKALV